MLRTLSVTNLAVIEQITVGFGSGLNVITGETGSGKSVLMGALSLVMGGRASGEAVREGAKEARIEATFSGVGDDIAALLDASGLPPCEGGELILRRTIGALGGGRVWVNDAPSTVQTLKKLGRLLIAIQDANDNPVLSEAWLQRDLLDAYVGAEKARATYHAAWTQYCAVSDELAALDADSADGVAEEIDRLSYAVHELREAALSVAGDADLAARHAAAAHRAAFLEEASRAAEALNGDDEGNACASLARVRPYLLRIAKFDMRAEAWLKMLEDVTRAVDDLSRDIAVALSHAGDDADEFAALDQRVSLIERLKRKYGCADVAALVGLCEKRSARLAELEGRDARRAALKQEKETAEEAVRKAGAAWTKLRKQGAVTFAKGVRSELRGLGFMKADFDVQVTSAEMSPNGMDNIEYRFAPNPGEPPRALGAIASSGEMARVMLAVKATAAEHDGTPILVFDEIDSNIGGETGWEVGRRLRKVSHAHQVIAITHLAQSAVWGEHHLQVSKMVMGGRTRTQITDIAGDVRVTEIARMLGGVNLTRVTAEHARELLAKVDA